MTSGAQRGRRERGEQRTRATSSAGRRGQRDQRVELAAAAEGVADDGAAAAAAHREAVEQPGGQVARTQGEQFRVGVDPVAVPGGERTGGQDVVGVADEHRPDRRQERGGQVGEPRRRAGPPTAAARDLADQAHPSSRSENAATAPAARRIPISGVGSPGEPALHHQEQTSTPPASSAVGACTSPRLPTNERTCGTSSPVTGMPVTFSSWLTIMSTAIPAM